MDPTKPYTYNGNVWSVSIGDKTTTVDDYALQTILKAHALLGYHIEGYTDQYHIFKSVDDCMKFGDTELMEKYETMSKEEREAYDNLLYGNITCEG